MPYQGAELENVILKLGRTRAGVRSLNSPQARLARSFGQRLFDAVFAGEVGTMFQRSLDEAGDNGAGLRVRLRLGRVPELADIPWEYLYSASLGRFLVLSGDTPVVRYLDLPRMVAPLRVSAPLRILLVVCAPIDLAALDHKDEVARLERELDALVRGGSVVIDPLPDPTLAGLRTALRRGEYHVLHFIGHGGFNPDLGDGILAFEDAHHRSHRVSGADLGTILHDHHTLRLAVLNACEGARQSPTDPFSGVAQSLVRQGIPAVVAMQFEITDAAALVFGQEFYAAIADGYPIDAALAQARLAVFSADNDVEWGTPVLYLRARDGRIFDIPGTPVPAALASLAPGADPEAPAEPLPEPSQPVTKRWEVTRRTFIRAVVGGAVATAAVGTALWANSRQPDGMVEPDWAFETGDEVYSSPAVADGRVLIGSVDSNLYCLDAATGEQRWKYATGGSVTSSPAVADGTVFVGSNDMHLHAVTLDTGRARWTYAAAGVIHSSPTVSGGTVYVGARDNFLHAVNAAEGSARWRFKGGNWFNSSPTVANGTLYVGCRDHEVYALDAATGRKRWSYTTRSTVDSSPTAALGKVFVGGDDHDLYALEARTGRHVWAYTAGGGIVSTPFVDERVVYVGSDDGNLYAIDADTGRERWRTATGSSIRSSPAVADGVVYVGSRDSSLYAVDVVTGEIRWRFPTGGPIDDSSPAVAAGSVYVGSLDRHVYSLPV
ncbi:MAG: PQQ-binding-like beta-propeller repeat protein [Intrasporangium sp.]|nr:PQQ-binding-like beta-propeller repeat protein [Intrasporangium sp.]